MSGRRIFIGDLQGCCEALERLLEKLKFDPAADRLRFVGDLVNRGGESLQALRRVHSLGAAAETVLGNHDLHLLAWVRTAPERRKPNAEFEAVAQADDGRELLDWLQTRPLMLSDRERRVAVVHAGVDPRWDPVTAEACAREMETVLGGAQAEAFFARMYGNRPQRWSPELTGAERWRATVNVFTRIRYCRADGRLDLESPGFPDRPPEGMKAWFELRHAAWRDWTIVFGHWSLLGLYRAEGVVGLDSGCVWGRSLSALVIDGEDRRFESVDCPQRRAPK